MKMEKLGKGKVGKGSIKRKREREKRNTQRWERERANHKIYHVFSHSRLMNGKPGEKEREKGRR